MTKHSRKVSWTPEEEDAFDTDLWKGTHDLANRPYFKPWSWNEIEEAGDLGWLCGSDNNPVLLAMALWCIYGIYKSGKTYYAFELAFCIAFGISFNGLPTANCDIVYLIAEGGVRRMRRRFEALYAKYHDQLKDRFPTAKRAFDSGHFSMVANAVNLADFNSENGVDKLLAQIDTSRKYGAVFLDTWALMLAAAGGHDSDSETVMPSVHGCKRIQNDLQATVCLVAHVGYSQSAQERPKGLSDLPGALDGATLAKKTDKKGVEHFEFTSMIQRHALNGYVVHAKLVEHGPNVALDFTDADGVVIEALTGDQKKAYDFLVEAGGELSLGAWRAKCEDLFKPDNKVTDKKAAWRNAWKRTRAQLIKKAKLVVVADGIAKTTTKATTDDDFGDPQFGR